MRTGRPNGLGAGSRGATRLPPGVVLALVLALILAPLGPPGSARAADGPAYPVDLATAAPAAPSRGWISLALLAGSTQFDTGLADYQWDTTPRIGWGATGLIGRGRFATGLELWRAGTTQSIGDLGPSPEVHATSLELVGEVRLVEYRSLRLWVRGHGGWLRLGYHPDQITIQPPGPVSPIAVGLDPVDTWTGGGGLAVRRPLGDHWSVGLGLDARRFTIDTAHREGSQIVYGRETFGDWSARCEVARTLGSR
jgi:hypothetical protein